MSSVFKSPKTTVIQPVEVVPETVDSNEIVYNLEKKRKKKMGPISQLLSQDNSTAGVNGYKKTLGE